MQLLRSHIVKLYAISLIVFGLGLCMVQPACGQNSTRSFANWFAEIAKANHSDELAKELDQLKNSGVDLRELVRHASQIISRNNNDFNLPLGKSPASHQIYQVLLAQWNQYQTGSGMANMPPPETVKPGAHLQVDKSGAATHIISNGFHSFRFTALKTISKPSVHSPGKPAAPMAAGIAIGAP